MKQLISSEIKDALLTKQLLPTYEEMAAQLNVSKATIYRVMNGQSTNRKVINFILNTVGKKSKEISQFGNLVLSN